MKTLSDAAYDILRDAVDVAREFQCRSIKALKLKLEMRWPGQTEAIDEAIQFWADHVRECHPDGVY